MTTKTDIQSPVKGLFPIRIWKPGIQPEFRGSMVMVAIESTEGLQKLLDNSVLPPFLQPKQLKVGNVVLFDHQAYILCVWDKDAVPLPGFEHIDILCSQFLAE